MSIEELRHALAANGPLGFQLWSWPDLLLKCAWVAGRLLAAAMIGVILAVVFREARRRR